MKVLKHDEDYRIVRMRQETEEKAELCDWINCCHIPCDCSGCHVEEYIVEFAKKYPNGATYDETVEFLEAK